MGSGCMDGALGMGIVWYDMAELHTECKGQGGGDESSKLGWGVIMKGLLCHSKEFVLCLVGNGEPLKDFKKYF